MKKKKRMTLSVLLRRFSAMCLKYLGHTGPKDPGAASPIYKTTGKK